MLIATLAIIGGTAGVIEFRKGARLLGFWAVSVCSTAFLVNLL